MSENTIDKDKEEGIRQGIWLCIQKLVHMEQYDMAKHFIKSFGFDRNECNRLLDKNGSDDEMESFIARMILDKDDKMVKKIIKECINEMEDSNHIKYEVSFEGNISNNNSKKEYIKDN